MSESFSSSLLCSEILQVIEINIVSSDLSSRRARLYSKKLLQAVGSIILSHCYSRGGPQNIAGQSQAMRGSHSLSSTILQLSDSSQNSFQNQNLAATIYQHTCKSESESARVMCTLPHTKPYSPTAKGAPTARFGQLSEH